MTMITLPTLPLSAHEQKLLKLIEAEPPSQAKHCFNSAIQHLQRAHLLVALDPAMAVFRGITAEEEAASGLMQVLIARKYPGAERLKPKDHVQKHAVTPFLRSVLRYFSHISFSGVNAVKLAFKEVDGNTRLVTAIKIDESQDGLWASPIPPLNLSVREGVDPIAPNFKPDFQKLIESEGYVNILSFLKSEANTRNRVLYAGKDGYPVISELHPEFLLDRQHRVFLILKTALLIWPYEEIQPFVAEALTSFLQLVSKILPKLDT